MEFEKDENFEVELFDPEGGAKIGKMSRTAVTITNDDGENSDTFYSYLTNRALITATDGAAGIFPNSYAAAA